MVGSSKGGGADELSAAAIAASGALYRATMTLTPARELLRLRKQAER